MSASHKLGSSNPVETGGSVTTGNRETCTVIIEGLYSTLAALSSFSSYIPSGYELSTKTLDATGDGLGRITLNCVSYYSGEASGWSAIRSTFRVEMCETSLDLITHTHITHKDVVRAWLATDEAERASGTEARYRAAAKIGENDTEVADSEAGEEGSETKLWAIADQDAIDFCNAYVKGITTYIRFDPVIEKQSVWKNPPGLTRSGTSFTGGSLGSSAFSSGIGTFDTPPITLNGYANTNFFKSKDSWGENADRTWTRTEQWTYTPDGPSSNVGWIYASSSSSSSSSSGGSSS